MIRKKKQTVQNWRFYVILAFVGLGLAVLISRIFYLNVVERKFLLSQGDARTIRNVKIPAYRGMITDRNGVPLAISVPVDSVWIDPREFKPTTRQLYNLAKRLSMPVSEIQKIARKSKKREFAYLERGLNPSRAKEVDLLNVPGVHLLREYRRYYPEGEVTAHLLGFTNVDDQGQEGLELVYNHWLQGMSGLKRVMKDRLGHIIADLGVIKEAKPGQNLALSIDSRLQYVAYRDLKQAVQKYGAKAGSIVLMDVKTGEVLAMVNAPSYNPNHRPKVHDGRYRNRAVTDVFEPGSTIKAFSVVNALDSHEYQSDSKVDTSPGWYMIDGHKVSDPHDNGVIDLTTILQRSSNVGISKLTLSLPSQSLWNLLHKVGFGERTTSGFPGESPGELEYHHKWRPFDLATLSFGYGLAVTPLQLAHAYEILANGGVKLPVSLLKLDGETPKGERIISQQTARDVLTMLETVVEKGGTAVLAQVPGYHVTGKTGTVRMVGPHGYEHNHHIAIFVGAAPASRPRLVASVVIWDPKKGPYYGGLVAAPVFSKVMGSALRILNIAPDRIETSKSQIGRKEAV